MINCIWVFNLFNFILIINLAVPYKIGAVIRLQRPSLCGPPNFSHLQQNHFLLSHLQLLFRLLQLYRLQQASCSCTAYSRSFAAKQETCSKNTTFVAKHLQLLFSHLQLYRLQQTTCSYTTSSDHLQRNRPLGAKPFAAKQMLLQLYNPLYCIFI